MLMVNTHIVKSSRLVGIQRQPITLGQKSMNLPPDIAGTLEGDVQVGSWEPALLLVTAAPSTAPHVCLLSRTEVAYAADRLCVVTPSRTVRANLAASDRATLLLHAEAPCSVELRLSETVRDGSLTGYLFCVTSLRRDDIGVALRPLAFLVEPWLPEAESWASTGRLVADLIRRAGQR
jgi:hypothetical protein